MELKLGEIKFDEIYLDEKPKDNYWRGIIATINNITVLRIPLEENYCGSRHDILYVSPDGGLIPYYIVPRGGLDSIKIGEEIENEDPDSPFNNNTFKIEDKELAKKRAVEIIHEYFSLFESKDK
jgi:hypothetical protein